MSYSGVGTTANQDFINKSKIVGTHTFRKIFLCRTYAKMG